MGRVEGKRDYIRLLEEHERFDIEVGRVTVELLRLAKTLPQRERRRVERFLQEWDEGRHTLAEARELLRELKRRYGGRGKRGR